MSKITTEQKIILFIVEGPSEEAALGTIMQEYFSSSRVQFQTVHGDITTKDYVNKSRIIEKVNTVINNFLAKYRYHADDIAQVIHITDTDGAFIPDQCIEESKINDTRYYPDHIESGTPEQICSRNHRKAAVLNKLSATNTIQDIPYRIYYNSCNLEHVLYKELKSFSNEEKMELSDAFADEYETHAEDFVSFISDSSLAAPGSYHETWKFISRDSNSLSRYTNLHQIFT